MKKTYGSKRYGYSTVILSFYCWRFLSFQVKRKKQAEMKEFQLHIFWLMP